MKKQGFQRGVFDAIFKSDTGARPRSRRGRVQVFQMGLGLVFALGCTHPALARPVRIIHTNDLHSNFDHAQDPTRGSYAAVKSKIEELKKRSAEEGIPTLVMDAGDFSEGSVYYLGARGMNTWKMMNEMGYDAVVLGNHDWLQGPQDLNLLLGLAPPNFVLTTANFLVDARLRNLERTVQTHAEFVRAGLKIAVLGLTTSDFLYSWRVDEGLVTPPIAQAQDLLPWLNSKFDVVIALTHIGVHEDVKLARMTQGISVVVGGHSHTELKEPLQVKNKKGEWVPIVQTGEHGASVGNLLIDLEKGQVGKVLDYRLEPVYVSDPRSARVDALVEEAHRDVEAVYGERWLKEVVAVSPEPLIKQTTLEPTYWSMTAAEAFKQAGRAELGFDVVSMHGNNQPAGVVTRETLLRMYPRLFEFDHPMGWTVWTAQIRGWVLKLAVEQIVMRNIGAISLAGVTYDKVIKNGKVHAKNIRFNGKPVYVLKDYKVAFPEGIVRGAIEIAEPLRLLFKYAKDTQVPVWTALENQFKRQTQGQ